MRLGGKTLGVVVIIVVILVVVFTILHNNSLEQERNETIDELMSLPPDAECNYEDPALCPQVEDNVALPSSTAIGLTILGILLGIYLFTSGRTQNAILNELKTRRQELSSDSKRDLVYSILSKDEKKVVEAVRKQPGITQATLRLRTDLSKAKLSTLLKDLEKRGIVKKVEEGRTNTVHLKMEL